MATHAGLKMRSLMSSFRDVFWFGSGLTRSFVVKNVMTKNTTASEQKTIIVSWKPLASLPLPKNLTKSIAKLCTTSVASIAKIKRYCKCSRVMDLYWLCDTNNKITLCKKRKLLWCITFSCAVCALRLPALKPEKNAKPEMRTGTYISLLLIPR